VGSGGQKPSENQFESVIDGQLIITGFSFIFNKEFNAFKELWMRVPKQEAFTEEKEEEEQEENKIEDQKIEN
jgi:translocation and assembly module TamB